MSREEAIMYLKNADATVGREIKTKTAEALEMAIKALEQETVSKESYDHEYFLRKDFELKIDKLQCQLDKVRTEIERQEKWLMDAGYDQYNVDIALDTIKSVVDKYKEEKEIT